jgi:hypothetical protein
MPDRMAQGATAGVRRWWRRHVLRRRQPTITVVIRPDARRALRSVKATEAKLHTLGERAEPFDPRSDDA